MPHKAEGHACDDTWVLLACQICGKRVWGAGTAKPFPSASSMKPPMPPPSGGSFGNPIFTLETCQKDLAEAIANEDFLCNPRFPSHNPVFSSL
jgi:hypothetical protein